MVTNGVFIIYFIHYSRDPPKWIKNWVSKEGGYDTLVEITEKSQ